MNFKQTLTLTTATLGLSLGVVGSAQAALIVNVTGIAGSGQTTWAFSGSTTVTDDDVEDFDTTTKGEEWLNLGDYIADSTLNFGVVSPVSGSATFTVGAGTQSITKVGLDFDPGTNDDDFGIAVANVLGVTTGNTVSWAGSLILPLDLTQLNLGTFGPALGASAGGLNDIQITIAAPIFPGDITPQSTPEPASILGLLVAGASGLALRRRQA